jgi:hypothetical protein
LTGGHLLSKYVDAAAWSQNGAKLHAVRLVNELIIAIDGS